MDIPILAETRNRGTLSHVLLSHTVRIESLSRLNEIDVMRRGVIAALIATLAVVISACAAAEPNIDSAPSHISVTAEILETDVPVSVDVSQVRAEDDAYHHEVLVTWEGDTGVVLNDARFTHRISDGDGVLLVAGRGCGWNWIEERQEELTHLCTADLKRIAVGPGDTHEYPVTIQPAVGPVQLAPGTYALEEQIGWRRIDDPGSDTVPTADRDGAVTVRLTYVVRTFGPLQEE